MNFNHLKNYILERNGPDLKDPDQAGLNYLAVLARSGATIKSYDFGFSTYRKVGDALVVADIYLAPEFRKIENQKYAWQIFQDLKDEAQKLEVNLIIGFSENLGTNKHRGERAMKLAGFQKVYETEHRDIYMRGTH